MYIGCSKGAVAQGNFSWILPRNFPLIATCKEPYNTLFESSRLVISTVRC